ncbi:hypothetical protein AB0D30_21770 [Streptomyces sp. NPDC048409]|uniref:hypothetical protein n=1 Tax=Streptomyces sp. NPDC048409 TaxID=3154723 RepID=UPI0034383390
MIHEIARSTRHLSNDGEAVLVLAATPEAFGERVHRMAKRFAAEQRRRSGLLRSRPPVS